MATRKKTAKRATKKAATKATKRVTKKRAPKKHVPPTPTIVFPPAENYVRLHYPSRYNRWTPTVHFTDGTIKLMIGCQFKTIKEWRGQRMWYRINYGPVGAVSACWLADFDALLDWVERTFTIGLMLP